MGPAALGVGDRPRVGLLSAYFLHIGGVERTILYLIENMSDYSFVVIGPVSDAFRAQVERRGAAVVPWHVPGRWSLRAALRLRLLLRTLGVRLLHIQDPRAGFVGRWAARWVGVPVVYAPPLPAYRYADRRWKRRLYRWVERFLNHFLTDRIVYVSRDVYREALQGGIAPADRTVLIENGIDLRPYEAPMDAAGVRRSLDTPEDVPVLCFVGRLVESKGVDVLFRAVERLCSDFPTLRVWVVGDGPWRRRLEAQAEAIGGGRLIRFLGFRDDVPALLRASDVFVLPSYYEAMPLALLEAMAAGLPVVATDVGDHRYLVESGVTGWVVPPGDPVALAEALRRLLADPALRRRMGQAARHRVQAYSSVRMAERVRAVYASVLGKR